MSTEPPSTEPVSTEPASTEPETPLERSLRSSAPTSVRAPRLPSQAADGVDVAVSALDTAVGRLLVAVGRDDALLALTFAVDDAAEGRLLRRLAVVASPRVVRAPSRTRGVTEQVEQYLAGERRGFDLDVDLRLASTFQASVLAHLADVPYGRTTTYGELARSLGRPTASRAVGTALGANPLCVVLPCHRVVAGSGALTGYAGGLDAKRHLLALEASAS